VPESRFQESRCPFTQSEFQGDALQVGIRKIINNFLKGWGLFLSSVEHLI
jgi:hypothetical protein